MEKTGIITSFMVDTYLLVNSKTGDMDMKNAISEVRKGNIIIVYDGDDREGEADLIFHGSFVTPEKIEILRKNAGGLICVALDKKIADRFGLKFYTEILRESKFEINKMACKKTAYGDEPSFSIAVNHKNVYTGITDNDRALTIKRISDICDEDGAHEKFVGEFYAPGHVFLLIGRGIENRKGHTELALKIAEHADMPGVMVLCEMLGKGKALSMDEAKKYADKNGFAFLEGKEIW